MFQELVPMNICHTICVYCGKENVKELFLLLFNVFSIGAIGSHYTDHTRSNPPTFSHSWSGITGPHHHTGRPSNSYWLSSLEKLVSRNYEVISSFPLKLRWKASHLINSPHFALKIKTNNSSRKNCYKMAQRFRMPFKVAIC